MHARLVRVKLVIGSRLSLATIEPYRMRFKGASADGFVTDPLFRSISENNPTPFRIRALSRLN